LTPALAKIIASPSAPQDTVAQIEAGLIGDYPFASGLALAYHNKGPGGVEQQIANGMLEHGLTNAKPAIIKTTFRYLIDMRNCLAIRKLWHWQISREPPFTAGGHVPVTQLNRLWASQNDTLLTTLFTRLTGHPAQALTAATMEQGFLSGMTRMLRRAGRDPLGYAVILEYLWRSQLAAHNQLLKKLLAPDREDLLAEVLLI
jgi:hypothetical protein